MMVYQFLGAIRLYETRGELVLLSVGEMRSLRAPSPVTSATRNKARPAMRRQLEGQTKLGKSGRG